MSVVDMAKSQKSRSQLCLESHMLASHAQAIKMHPI